MNQLTLVSAARSSSPSVLKEVLEPDCNLSIWERDFSADLGGLLDGEPRDVRFDSNLEQLPNRLKNKLSVSGFADGPARTVLVADVLKIAWFYGDILGTDEMEVRLEVVTTNSCRKWHADYVKARLITTYLGTGTQWLDRDAAAQVKRGSDPDNFGQMAIGDVGIFKGKLATETPAIHRSPPIQGTGERRLLLVLNPVES